jgi:hypothetical protein
MKNFVSSVVLICIAIAVFGNKTKVDAQNEETKKARELWEQVIAAKGGREKLYAVRNLAVSEKTIIKRPKKDFSGFHTESLFVLPDKWWSWVDEPPFGIGIWAYDFTSQIGWEVDKGFPSQTVKPSTDDIRFRFVKEEFIQSQMIYLMETKWIQPTIVGARTERLSFQKVDVVETSYGTQKFEFFIDRKTHLPKQVIIRTRFEETGTSIDGREHVESFILDDYVEVSGIKFPKVVRRSDESNETTYQVNVDYKKSIFERPPTLDMGSEAWKQSP